MNKYKTKDPYYKICHRCLEETIKIDNFNKDKNGADGYQRYCKKCWKNIRMEKTKGREAANIYAKNFRKKHKNYVNILSREYRQTDKGKLSDARHLSRRRDISKTLKSDLTIEQWESCKQYFKDKENVLHCAYCDKIILRAEKEHFIALSKGGEFTKNNILPICKSCNSSKGNREFLIWYKKQPFYSKQRENKVFKYLKQ